MGKNLVIYNNELYDNINSGGTYAHLVSPYHWLKKPPISEYREIARESVLKIDSRTQLTLWFLIKYSAILGLFLNAFALLLNMVVK